MRNLPCCMCIYRVVFVASAITTSSATSRYIPPTTLQIRVIFMVQWVRSWGGNFKGSGMISHPRILEIIYINGIIEINCSIFHMRPCRGYIWCKPGKGPKAITEQEMGYIHGSPCLSAPSEVRQLCQPTKIRLEYKKKNVIFFL